MEITFNVAYLIVVWGLVAAMALRREDVRRQDRPVARRMRWAFALLALGDTGHVGFRVLAYALGNAEMRVNLLGMEGSSGKSSCCGNSRTTSKTCPHRGHWIRACRLYLRSSMMIFLQAGQIERGRFLFVDMIQV